MKLRHFFLPHPTTHKKAYLITLPALLIYMGVFLSVQVGMHFYGSSHPGVLGIASNISQQTLIQLTNQERAKDGLGPLKENADLDRAAAAKAQNMFAENYWAHFAPSGKSPWDFIKASGYNFSYAGENLARNFQNSSDVMDAWMNSPSHKENILNPHYQDIGMAVVNGTLLGEETTLVVQEFGTPAEAVVVAPEAPAPVAPAPAIIPAVGVAPQTAGVSEQVRTEKPFLDPFVVTRSVGLTIILVTLILIGIDWAIMRKRMVYRVSSRHLPHIMVLILALGFLLSVGPGLIK